MIATNIKTILSDLPADKSINLVAVSKTKPSTVILEAFEAGQRHFGENYVQELIQKAHELPKDIKWHLIGHLQSNKALSLVRDVPNLYMVETVDSLRIADHLQSACLKASRSTQLKVLVEVATSTEESKTGVNVNSAVDLVKHIIGNCSKLEFCGLMTVADPERPKDCFKHLADLRDVISTEISVSPDSLCLSMGMSGDWKEAVNCGSTEIRVGSAIFGSR